MLFTYPIAATTNNWVSSTIIEILRTALAALQSGVQPPNFHNAVPQIYKVEFQRGRKFSDLYSAFIDACRPLDTNQQELVLTELFDQNRFPEIFDANTKCPGIALILPAVHQAARNLFAYAFEKLSDLRTPGSTETVRARYHQLVHAHIESGCCPFCGLEIIEAPDPDLVDPDLDHYLAASKYPFAGANLRNLTAMGTTCNRSYKGAQDILLGDVNQRVDCMDPYGEEHVSLSLEGTALLPGGGSGPSWVINFDPDMKSRNWRRIFKMEKRLRLNLLERQYQTWLSHCISYAAAHNIDLSEREGALEAVRKFKNTCKYETFPTVARLKTSFFELIEAALANAESADKVHNFLVEAA